MDASSGGCGTREQEVGGGNRSGSSKKDESRSSDSKKKKTHGSGSITHLTKLRCTPSPRWTPLHSRQKKIPYETEAQEGIRAEQSTQTCFFFFFFFKEVSFFLPLFDFVNFERSPLFCSLFLSLSLGQKSESRRFPGRPAQRREAPPRLSAGFEAWESGDKPPDGFFLRRVAVSVFFLWRRSSALLRESLADDGQGLSLLVPSTAPSLPFQRSSSLPEVATLTDLSIRHC